MGAIRTQGARARPEAPADGAAGDDILRLLGRFGVARPDQIARHTGRDPSATARQLRALEALGLIHTLRFSSGAAAAVLSASGTRRLPALMPKQRVAPRQAAALVAALDVAWHLESTGAGRWVPWPEAVRAGLAIAQSSAGLAPAEGLLLPPPGEGRAAGAEDRAVPICVLCERPARRTLRQRAAAAARAAGGVPARIYVPPELAAEAIGQLAGIPAAVLPWGPGAGPAAPGVPAGLGVPGVAAGPGVPAEVSEAAAPRAPERPAAVTPKRVRALRLLCAFGYATVDQVARAQGTHATAASIMLAAMERSGLVQRHRQHHLHKDVYSATAAGAAASGLGLPAVPRIPAQRRHALALVDLAHELAERTGGQWETQREVAARLEQAGRAAPQWPDGRLVLPDGRRVSIELELSSQPNHAVLSFIAEQLGAGVCDEVWYVVSPEWEHRYASRLEGVAQARVEAWMPPDRLGGPRGFRADRVTREPSSPRILGRGRRPRDDRRTAPSKEANG